MNSNKPLMLGSFARETGLHLPGRMWFMPRKNVPLPLSRRCRRKGTFRRG